MFTAVIPCVFYVEPSTKFADYELYIIYSFHIHTVDVIVLLFLLVALNIFYTFF